MTRPENLGYLVFGATGAVGKACVQYLLSQDAAHVARVVTIGRRHLDTREKDPRLNEIIVDTLDNIDTNPQLEQQLQGTIDVTLCCLGTTRAVAGSAEAFKKVDVEYVGKAARLSKALGVRSFGLVSAQGANKNLWSSDYKMFHGLLYTKSKGLAEDLAITTGFPYTAIVRPGLLKRGEAARLGEKVGSWILPSVSVDAVARTMINACSEGCRSGGDGAVVETFEMKDIKKRDVASHTEGR